jgi:rubrerythrin
MFEELVAEEATHKDVFSKIDEGKAEKHKLCTLPESSIAKYLADVELGHRRRLEAIYEERVLTEGWYQGRTVL